MQGPAGLDPETYAILVSNGDGSFEPADFYETMGGWTMQLPRRPATTSASTAPASHATCRVKQTLAT